MILHKEAQVERISCSWLARHLPRLRPRWADKAVAQPEVPRLSVPAVRQSCRSSCSTKSDTWLRRSLGDRAFSCGFVFRLIRGQKDTNEDSPKLAVCSAVLPGKLGLATVVGAHPRTRGSE